MTEPVGSWLPDRELVFPSDDAFGVDKLIDQLVEQLVDAQPPFAVSLSGSWGVGKSTVAREIVKRLRANDVRCIYLDAWTLDVRHLRRHLVVEIGASLATPDRKVDPDPETRRWFALKRIDEPAAQTTEQGAAKVELRSASEVWEGVDRSLTSLLNIMALVVGLVASGVVVEEARTFFFGLAGILSLGLLTTYVLKITTPSRSRAATAEDVALANVFAETVSKQPSPWLLPWQSEKPSQIVIVVDNLDRLSGEDALIALSQIRALLDIKQSRCVFLIPIDRKKLEDHLQRELRGVKAGADYLQKFFGLDLALTQPEPVDLRRWAQGQAKDLAPGVEDAESARVADIVVSAAQRSPRAITRLLNGAVTRYRVVSALGRELGLDQAALIESVLLLAPAAVERMEVDAKAFTELREGLTDKPEADRLRVVGEFLDIGTKEPSETEAATQSPAENWPMEVGDLLRFLLLHRAIPLEWEQLRVALALRENRLWVGVSNWEPLQTALDNGDETAFAEALEGREDYRSAIIECAAQALLEGGASAGTLARGLNVLANRLDPLPPNGVTLRRTTSDALQADSSGLTLLSEAAVNFLLPIHAPIGLRMAEAITKAVEETEKPEGTGLARAAVLIRPSISDEQVDRIRKRFATWPLPVLAPIFDHDSGADLVAGPVADALIQRIAAWTPDASNHEDVIADVRALSSAQKHGWSEGDLDPLAISMASQANAIVGNSDAQPVAERMVDLLAESRPSAAIDQVGETFGQAWPDGQQFFHWALRLPLGDPALPNVVQRFDQLASGADLTVVAGLLDEHRDRLDGAKSQYRPLLFDRWRTQGDGLAAQLAMIGDPNGAQALVVQWRGVPPDQSLARALAGFAMLEEHASKADAKALADALEDMAPTWPADLAGLDELVASMKGKTITRGPLVRGLVERVKRASTAVELDQLCRALEPVIDVFGVNQRRDVADELARGLNRLGVDSPEAVTTALKRSSSAAPREDVAVKLVDAGLDLPRTLNVLDEIRTLTNRAWRVRAALVGRATKEHDEGRAATDLEEARKWRRPPKAEMSAVEADLGAVVAEFPTLVKLVDTLR